MSRKDTFGLRYPNHDKVYLDRFGSEFQIAGVFYAGKYGLKILVILPGSDKAFSMRSVKVIEPNVDEWIEILKYSDDPHYFETSPDGKSVKAIHRKSARQIGYQIQWDVYRRAGFKCEYCGHARPLTIDHHMPVELGGSDEIGNLKAACRPCNRRKGNMHPDEWENEK